MVTITLLQFSDYLRESLGYLRAIAMPADLDNPAFQDDDLAREWFEARIWPDGPVCTHCSATGEGRHEMFGKKHRVGAFQCNACGGQFTVADRHCHGTKPYRAAYLAQSDVSAFRFQKADEQAPTPSHAWRQSTL